MQATLSRYSNLETREGSVFDLLFEDKGHGNSMDINHQNPSLVIRGVQLGMFYLLYMLEKIRRPIKYLF